MNARILIAAVFAVICLPMAGRASAGSFGRAFVPNTTGGIQISCANPHSILGAVRTDEATTVFQAGPDGVHWQVVMPPMVNDFDYFWFAPDGSAAVVALSVWRETARAFLVSGRREPIEIDGLLSTVDFQKNRALVATHALVSGTWTGTRVRVYDLDSGDLLGDTVFEDRLAFTVTHDADKQLTVRLSEDGRSYYYIRWTKPVGDELVVRDVVSGERRPLRHTFADGQRLNANIHDALLYSYRRGYMAAGGKLFALGDRNLVPIDVDEGIGQVVRLLESENDSRQAVVWHRGWGVFDTESRRWLMIKRGGYARLLSSDTGVTVVDMSRKTPGMKTYDFSGPQPRLVRRLVGVAMNDSTFMCANEFGTLHYCNGKFTWLRTVNLP